MENKKKMWTKFSSKRFSNINFRKKKEKRERKKEEKKEGGRAQFVINFHEPNNSNIFYLYSW